MNEQELKSIISAQCSKLRKDVIKRLPRSNATKKSKYVLGPEYVGCIGSGMRPYISAQPAAAWQRAKGDKQLFCVYNTENDKDFKPMKPSYIGYDRSKALAAFMRACRKVVKYNVEARVEIIEAQRKLKSNDPSQRVAGALTLGDHGLVVL